MTSTSHKHLGFQLYICKMQVLDSIYSEPLCCPVLDRSVTLRILLLHRTRDVEYQDLCCSFTFFFKNLFIILAVLGLHCFVRVFSSYGKQRLFSAVVCQLPIGGGFSSFRVVHGLSCPVAYGIFPDQGSNPCPLHWQADSYPLYHQGSPLATSPCPWSFPIVISLI